MRKLMVFLAIIAILASACSFNSSQGPSDPTSNPGQQPPGPVDPPDTDPGNPDDDGDDDVSLDPAPAELIWVSDSPPSSFQDIQAGNTLLYLAVGTITAQDLETGAILWSRDLAQDGYELYEELLYETPPHLEGSALTYPLCKNDKVYVEQINISTGDVLWLLEVGREGEVSFLQWEGELLSIISGPYPDEKCVYYSVHTGEHIPCLDGTTAYWHQGAYFTFTQVKPYRIAKYDVGTGEQIWQTDIKVDMSYPYLGEIWSQGNTVLFNLADFNGADVQYLTLAVDDLDGTVKWSKEGSRADSRDNNVILIAEGKTILVDIATGQEVQEIASEGNEDSVSFIWNGALYITEKTSLKKIDISSGETVWQKPMAGRIDLYYGVTPEDNLRDMEILWALLERTTVGDEYLEEQLAAIDPATGEVISSFPFTVPFGGPESWPIKLTQDEEGRLYIVLEKNAHKDLQERSVLLIDAPTGQELWEYEYPENYNEINVFFSNSSNLVVVLRNFSQEVEVIYLAKQTGVKRHHFQAEGYPSLMIGDRILMNMAPSKTSLIAPPK